MEIWLNESLIKCSQHFLLFENLPNISACLQESDAEKEMENMNADSKNYILMCSKATILY